MPRYRTPSVNAPVVLETGPVTLRHGETCEAVPDGSFEFAWLPLPGVVVSGPPGFRWSEARFEGAISIECDGGFRATRVEGLATHAASNGDVYIRRTESTTPRLRHADIHVLNLPPMAGYALGTEGGVLLGRQSWRFGEWSMTMDPIPMPTHLVREAKGNRGNLLTHIVRVSRTDSSSFGIEELDQVVDDLHLALSFAFGDDVGPMLAAGRDDSGEVILELLRAYPCEGWRPRFGPAPRYSGIGPMMESLGTILAKPDDGVREAVVYHVQACFGMVESTVFLAQASLDRLANHCLVVTRKILTEAEYDNRKRTAAVNIRQAMQELGIPTGLGGRDDMDLPDLITNCRNRVHVRARAKAVEAGDVYEQALQTTELMMLALAGYTGLYHPRGSRRSTDEVLVPWVK